MNKVVDTTGAGDSFAGGYLAAGRDVDRLRSPEVGGSGPYTNSLWGTLNAAISGT